MRYSSSALFRSATLAGARYGTAQAGSALDFFKEAPHERLPVRDDELVHHSDRKSRYLALC